MKRMIISQQGSETTVALLENEELAQLDIECKKKQQKKTNIYRAKIAKIEHSLNAIFIQYENKLKGFLPFKELNRELYNEEELKLKVGDFILVQLTKEAKGEKGAAFTTFITLTGKYLALKLFSSKPYGISNNLDDNERKIIKHKLSDLSVPKNTSLIVRTYAKYSSKEGIQEDINSTYAIWRDIIQQKSEKTGLVYSTNNVLLRAVRDMLAEDVEEIVVDCKEVYNQIVELVNIFKSYQSFNIILDKTNLLAKYKIGSQIENIYNRTLELPSRGRVVFDHTEALTAIDVNSARANKAECIEDTATQTNLEAVKVIATQLKIRDISGLIVIDFIEMKLQENIDRVEQALIKYLSQDKATIQVTQISKLGLVEISRQHIQAPLRESIMQPCGHCKGTGREKSFTSFKSIVLQAIELAAKKSETIYVYIVENKYYDLVNECREYLSNLESRYHTDIIVLPARSYEISGEYVITYTEPQKIYEQDNRRPIRTTIVAETTNTIIEEAPKQKAKGNLWNNLISFCTNFFNFNNWFSNKSQKSLNPKSFKNTRIKKYPAQKLIDLKINTPVNTNIGPTNTTNSHKTLSTISEQPNKKPSKELNFSLDKKQVETIE